ncbi:efflux RND transporter periplasmic adaptor subunit [Desulfovibrio inopinatus]|uniref:efflux RND transporter periplasmic adaptor subunit n=1 Tax=Desulfovibrio inopinatus TaxID=102109 RepID=UPI0003FAEA59|nr:efflux RND transporter periplasmic adaptor subunit [Desulfovibrio inopinatus]
MHYQFDRKVNGLLSDGWRKPMVLAFCLLVLVSFSGCNEKKQEASGPPPPVPVKTITVKSMDAPDNLNGIGHVQAKNTVRIQAQVTGILKEIHFNEGDMVQQGQKLFTIDPEMYQAKVAETQAQLQLDTAKAKQSERDFLRYKDLVARNAVSEDEYEQYRTAYEAALEQVQYDQATLKTANINLGYCFISSPVSGVAGLLSVKQGNLVMSNSTELVTVNQVQPINVLFSLPEVDLAEIQKYAKNASLTVAVTPQGGGDPHKGKLTVVNNTVDETTGMISLQAEFLNDDLKLWPGQFVEAALTLRIEKNAVVVPNVAVMESQQGRSSFVVKSDKTVELRQVEIEREMGRQYVIKSGLKAGDVVVTDGQLKLRPGVTVKILSDNEKQGGEAAQKTPKANGAAASTSTAASESSGSSSTSPTSAPSSQTKQTP